jgi:hypothetical protein
MKEGNLTVLYTKETRKVYATCSVAIEQQNNRALCRSRVTPPQLGSRFKQASSLIAICCLRHHHSAFVTQSER